MDETFKIYVYRLRDGHIEKIEEDLPPDFLGIQEAELAFRSPVHVRGEASLTDTTMVLRLHVETEATLPCAICNQDVPYKIVIPNLCCTRELDEIKNGIFNYQDVLREEILLGVPYTVECNGGDCPERAVLAKYFTK